MIELPWSAEAVEAAISRIAHIDGMFEAATGWGSWTVGCANERERLTDWLREHGVRCEHRYQARTSDGGRTS